MTSEKLEQRLRQVLELLIHAPSDYTRIHDDQGSFLGDGPFLTDGVREQAESLLAAWDEEDGTNLKP